VAEGMPIGEICRKAGCTARTIRYYEAEGLLTSTSQTSGGRKLYGEDTIGIIQLVQVLQRIGYSIKDIRHVLALLQDRHTKDRQLTFQLRNLLADVSARIEKELDLLAGARGKVADVLLRSSKCTECQAEDCAPCGKLRDLRTLGFLAVTEK